jgi:hypothetical protein
MLLQVVESAKTHVGPTAGVKHRTLQADFTAARKHLQSAHGFHTQGGADPAEIIRKAHRSERAKKGQISSPALQTDNTVPSPLSTETPSTQYDRWGYLNVRQFGAVADGQTDDTTAFQNALNAAGSLGSRVFVPAGTYMLNGSLTVPPETVLEGVNEYPFSAFDGGSILLTNSGQGNANAAAFIFLQGPDAGVRGLTIQYLNQEPTLSTPTVYPPCIQGEGNNLSVLNMLLGNPYIAIDFATNSCPRHLIENVYGQPISLGITVDQIYDIGRIRHIHFWPFWAPYPSNLVSWIMTNGVTFRILRSDWEVVEDVFSWGYNRGIVFSASAHGACNGQFTDVDFDNVNVGIELISTQGEGVLFSNLNIANAGNGDIKSAIRCPAGGWAQLVVRGFSAWGQWNRGVHWMCDGALALSDGIFDNWNPQMAAIEATSGRLNIRGNYFQDVIGAAIVIGSSVDRAVVTGNDLIGNTITCSGHNMLCQDNLA